MKKQQVHLSIFIRGDRFPPFLRSFLAAELPLRVASHPKIPGFARLARRRALAPSGLLRLASNSGGAK